MTTKEKIVAAATAVSVLANKAFGMVPLGLIHCFTQTNDSRVETRPIQQAGKNAEQGVFESIRENGWKQDEPIGVQPFETLKYKIGGILYTADMAIAARLEQMALWKQKDETLPLYNTMLRVWFVDGDIERPIRPLYMAVDGNRRLSAMPEILATHPEPETFTVPVISMHFASNQERIVFQVAANTARQMAGVKNLTWPDYLKAGVRILDNGGNENAMRRAFGKVGTAQKVSRIIAVSNLTRQVGKPSLLDRCAMAAPKKDERVYVADSWVPSESLDKEALQKILKEHGNSKELAIAALEEYLQGIFAGKKNADKVTGKDVWAALTCDAGSPFDKIRSLHLAGLPFGPLKDEHPELFSARYSGFIAEPANVQPTGVESTTVDAKTVENVKETARKSAQNKGKTMAGAKGRK